MRRVLIDTNVYSAFKLNDTDTVESFKNLDYIGMDITVLAELYSGFRGGKKEKQNRKELEEFFKSSRVHLLNHDIETAEFYAGVYRTLRNNGTPIPTNDLWIAAVAMQHGLTLFSYDDHFTKIDGLLLRPQ